MKKTTSHIILQLLSLVALCSCSSQGGDEPVAYEPLQFTSSIIPYDGDAHSRVNTAGYAFLTGDLIRIKVICPFVSGAQYGETWNGSFDAFWLLKRTIGGWGPLTAADGCDVNGDYRDSGSSAMSQQIHSQQTPYVFTAQTWGLERKFCTSAGKLVLQYTPVFHADQSREENYRASDILWAQSYLQTGSESVHFDFYHKMAALCITIDGDISENAVLTLEGMPGIDQAEVIIGDYYAARSKINSDFGYKQKNVCTVENNGKVLGVGVNTATAAYTMPLTGNPNPAGRATVPNDGIYTAFNAGAKVYRLIVPPCELPVNAVVWLRDDDKRWKSTLEQVKFEEGVLYNITIKI